MRNYPFPLTAALALLLALPSHAAEKPRTAQGAPNQSKKAWTNADVDRLPAQGLNFPTQSDQTNQNQTKKVWTNADMDDLRARGLLSIVGPEVSEAAQPAPVPSAETVPVGPGFPVYASRLDDPEWYAEQAADLQAELDQRLADLRQQQDAIALAKERITQPGLNMAEGNAGVTVEAGLAILQARVQEIQDQLDELADLARQHNIPPGALRS